MSLEWLDKEYIELLKEFEGYFPSPYLCPTGHVTIGYGTNLEAHRQYIDIPSIRKACNVVGRKLYHRLLEHRIHWDKQKAEAVMLDELSHTDATLRRCVPEYEMLIEKGEIVRAECLLDMAYNMGTGNLMAFKKTLAEIRNGNYLMASQRMEQSKWYKQVGRRSKCICYMMTHGKYPYTF